MVIRHSQMADLERIMEIYGIAREFMKNTGNPDQWGQTNWPPRELIIEDIRTSRSYVCEENGRILGTFFYDFGKDIEPTYRCIHDGEWMDDSSYGVVHRIASDGTAKGTGSFCLNWAYEKCGHLRIDTHGDNKVMQNLLKKLGFKYCGIIFVEEDNDPRLAFEKSQKNSGERA